jgi:hypothetical protein
MPALATRNVLDLAKLKTGCPALTPSAGAVLAEAASVCLSSRHAGTTTKIRATGATRKTYDISWLAVTKQMQRSYNNPHDAPRDGACGVAILLVQDVTGLSVVDRAWTGTGFDYWLGEDDGLFQNKARLEVSGILAERAGNTPASRLAKKKNQTKRSDLLRLPAHVVIVEFSKPSAKHAVRR